MLLSFKTALIPNNKQETLFRKASGVARHAYNWGNA
ncbi:helix-turn-helix domain-containing protein, partial [Cylindrospermopsis raciborskii]